MFHMLRLKYPFICQRLFLTQQTARTHQGWLCSTHIHTHTCGLALLFAQMWNSCMGRHRASSNTMPQSVSQYHLHSFYIPLWITAEMGMSAQLPSSLLLSELTQIPISSNLNRKLSNNHFSTETSPHPEESNSNQQNNLQIIEYFYNSGCAKVYQHHQLDKCVSSISSRPVFATLATEAQTELATSRTADASKKTTQVLAKFTDMNLEEPIVTENSFLLGNYLD